jgi:hypothetical protein
VNEVALTHLEGMEILSCLVHHCGSVTEGMEHFLREDESSEGVGGCPVHHMLAFFACVEGREVEPYANQRGP